jgi:hypothetical protein
MPPHIRTPYPLSHGGGTADDLGYDEGDHVVRADPGEAVGQRPATVTAGLAKEVDEVNQYATVM